MDRPAFQADKISEPSESKEELLTDCEMQQRQERVAAIKARVEAGTYAVDPEELSRKIIDDHLAKKFRS